MSTGENRPNDWDLERDHLFDEQAAAKRRQAEWDAEVKRRLSQIRAAEDAHDPALRAEIHRAAGKRGPYQKRQERQGVGPWLTMTAERVLRALAYLADKGKAAVTVQELADRIGASKRAVQYALARLEQLEMIARQIRPSRNPRRHLASCFTVLPAGWLRLGRRGPAGVGMQKFADPSENYKNNFCTDERSAVPAHRAAGAAPNGASAPRHRANPATLANAERPKLPSGKAAPGARSVEIPNDRAAARPGAAKKPARIANAETAALAAAQKLDPARNANTPDYDPFAVIDAARRRHLSRFDAGAWSRAVEAHGRETALLAAAVALLRPADGRGAKIRSAASYLGGMLRQSPGRLNPLASLSAILH